MKIQKNKLKNLTLIPVKDYLTVTMIEVESDKMITLPSNDSYGARQQGMTMLRVVKAGEDCSHVEAGDFVIATPAARSFMSFKVADKTYMALREEDVAAVIRGEDGKSINIDSDN